MTKEKDGNGPAGSESPAEGASVTLPAAEVEELRTAGAKAAEYLDLAKRTKADFINYQGRARREREEWQRFALEVLLRELLPVVDDLQRLLAAGEETDASTLQEGLRLTERELVRILAKSGVRAIETQGKKFDPAFHEAVETVPPPPGTSEGDLVQELRKGYHLHDRVLRPTQVVIARAPTSGAGT